MTVDLLALWVVYRLPRDFPRHYVVRVQLVQRGSLEPNKEPFACLYDTLEEAMFDCEAKGLTWIGRMTGDDPAIVGVFV